MAASRPGALQLSVPWLVPGGEAPVLPDPPLLSFLGHPSPHHEGTLAMPFGPSTKASADVLRAALLPTLPSPWSSLHLAKPRWVL